MAFPEHILAKLRQRRDLDVGDTSMDAAFNRCPPRIVFSEVLKTFLEWSSLRITHICQGGRHDSQRLFGKTI